MIDLKKIYSSFKKSHFKIVGVLFLILLALFLLWYLNANSMQATNAIPAQVYFDGEYSIAGGEWQKIEEGKHIPATKGDVTLRGNFHMLTPNGEYIGLFSGNTPIAFYTNHISLTFIFADGLKYTIDHENPLFGESACGVEWTSHAFAAGNTDPIEILVHNPHKFGNETAIDEMLSNFAFWVNIDFEKSVLELGETQRTLGILLMIVSLMFVGTALFSTMIHIADCKIIWLLGLVALFAGI